jgi:hypothetical protein
VPPEHEQVLGQAIDRLRQDRPTLRALGDQPRRFTEASELTGASQSARVETLLWERWAAISGRCYAGYASSSGWSWSKGMRWPIMCICA